MQSLIMIETDRVRMRSECDISKASIQWLQSLLKVHCTLGLQLELGKESLHKIVISSKHTNLYTKTFAWPLFGKVEVAGAGELWDYSDQLLTKEVNNTSK